MPGTVLGAEATAGPRHLAPCPQGANGLAGKMAIEQGWPRALLRATPSSTHPRAPLPTHRLCQLLQFPQHGREDAWDSVGGSPPQPHAPLPTWALAMCAHSACIFKELLSTLQNNEVSNIKTASPSAAICYYTFTGTLH